MSRSRGRRRVGSSCDVISPVMMEINVFREGNEMSEMNAREERGGEDRVDKSGDTAYGIQVTERIYEKRREVYDQIKPKIEIN